MSTCGKTRPPGFKTGQPLRRAAERRPLDGGAVATGLTAGHHCGRPWAQRLTGDLLVPTGLAAGHHCGDKLAAKVDPLTDVPTGFAAGPHCGRLSVRSVFPIIASPHLPCGRSPLWRDRRGVEPVGGAVGPTGLRTCHRCGPATAVADTWVRLLPTGSGPSRLRHHNHCRVPERLQAGHRPRCRSPLQQRDVPRPLGGRHVPTGLLAGHHCGGSSVAYRIRDDSSAHRPRAGHHCGPSATTARGTAMAVSIDLAAGYDCGAIAAAWSLWAARCPQSSRPVSITGTRTPPSERLPGHPRVGFTRSGGLAPSSHQNKGSSPPDATPLMPSVVAETHTFVLPFRSRCSLAQPSLPKISFSACITIPLPHA